jgi:putative transposase
MPFWRLFYHLVWATKGRMPLIDADREEIVRRSIRVSCHEHAALIHGLGVMPDHVHLAVSIPPRLAISDVMHKIKGSSSHLINQVEKTDGRNQFAWQPEYGVLSFGERALADIVAYVENQRTRHANDDLRPLFEQTERPHDPVSRRRS